MNDLTIKKLITLLIVIPTVGFLAVASYIQFGLWKNLSTAIEINNKTQLYSSISNLQSSLQKERDIATSYLGGGNDILDYELQIKSVNETLHLLQPVIKASNFPEKLNNKFMAGISDISTLRLSIIEIENSEDEADLDAEEIITEYSTIILSLMAFEKTITESVNLKGIGKFLSSISILEQAKNNMGKSQGIIAGILAEDESIDSDMIKLIINFQSSIDTGLQSPALIISQQGITKLIKAQKNKNWEITTDTFEVILDSAEDGNYGINPKQYLEYSSKTINEINLIILSELTSIQDITELIRSDDSDYMIAGFIVLTILTLIIILLGYSITRLVINPIEIFENEIINIEEKSDLTISASNKSKNEIGLMANAFNSMLEKFRNIIKEVSASTILLTTASDKMFSITSKTSNGINNQQTEIMLVATAMNQMSSTVVEVAHSAELAAETAQNMEIETQDGMNIVHQAVAAIQSLANDIEAASLVIHKLEKNSDNIGLVVDVIRGIAEQTNLLALNAAIEAARAGEQGRGFAVVADEVRVLAQRTKQSTKEIQDIIEILQVESRNAVQVMEKGQISAKNSVQHAVKAGQSFDSIATNVTNINNMNTQIASAAEEQTAVAEEINRNINNISQVADEGVVSVQQIATASKELSSMAIKLQQMVAIFKT